MKRDLLKEDDEKWMAAAVTIARKALNKGEFPVACILVSGGEIVGRGDRRNSSGRGQNELDHAEMLALKDWLKRGKKGGGFTAYTTLEPCLMCLGALILNGARRIVYAYEDIMGGATGLNFSGPFSRGSENLQQIRPVHLYEDFEKRITGAVLRQEALGLFRHFFSRPGNDYLRGSLLEKYTLDQQQETGIERGQQPATGER